MKETKEIQRIGDGRIIMDGETYVNEKSGRVLSAAEFNALQHPSTPAGKEAVNYQHRGSVTDMMVKFCEAWAEKDSPELLKEMVDFCMSLRPYPTKPSPQSEQAGEKPSMKEIIHKGIEFAKERETESTPYNSGLGYGYSCGYEAAIKDAALWQAASQEKGVGGMKVYSRPECPFQYCDSPNKECEKMNKCHHRP